MTTFAIIPARGGSRRIPGKNVKLFHGKPILAYSIEAAKSSGLFDEVFVSTDADDVAQIARLCGARVYMRPRALGADEVGTQEVMRDALHHLPPCFYACCIYPTAPLMSIADLREGLEAIRPGAGGFAYAFSVNIDPLHDAGQFYWGHAKAFMAGAPLVSYYSRMVPVAADRVCDINTPEDWARAEAMYLQLHKDAA